MYGLDLATRKVLWSFRRNVASAEPWRFDYLTPVDGGLWATTYGVVVKLQ